MPKPRKKTLKKSLKEKPKRKEPAWKGPEVDGVTQSMLQKFLVCKERFRIQAIEGWAVQDEFKHAIEYGNMWHECEEALAGNNDWREALKVYCQKLCKRYPLQQEQISKWYNVCLTQFPIYVDYWKNDSDEKNRTPLLQEETFNVPYELPSGRVVKLRGKWDSVDLIGKGKRADVWLKENKTKGDINEEQMRRQLTFDLQTMIYLIALKESCQERNPNPPWAFKSTTASVKGVRYNVIRRPLAGGRGSIRPHKATKTKPAETMENYYRRLGGKIEAEPEYYFIRWKVNITQEDIDRFKREFLNPCLEYLCDWYGSVTSISSRKNPFHFEYNKSLHYRMPYGVYNPLTQGRTTELDEYLISGSTVGLRQIENLFPELD
jgi:hypothetical protein